MLTQVEFINLCTNNNFLEIEKALNEGFNSNFYINLGQNQNYAFKLDTPLSFCIKKGHFQSAIVLLKKGAKVNLENKNQVLLCELGMHDNPPLELIELLIKNGSSVNEKGEGGFSPILNFSWLCDKKYIEILLNNGADINSTNKFNINAIGNMLASPHFSIDFFYYLVSKGGNYKLVDTDGETIVDYAKKNSSASKYSPLFSKLLSNNYSLEEIRELIYGSNQPSDRFIAPSNKEIEINKAKDYFVTIKYGLSNSANSRFQSSVDEELKKNLFIAEEYIKNDKFYQAIELYFNLMRVNGLHYHILLKIAALLAKIGLIEESLYVLELTKKYCLNNNQDIKEVGSLIFDFKDNKNQEPQKSQIKHFESINCKKTCKYLIELTTNLYRFNDTWSKNDMESCRERAQILFNQAVTEVKSIDDTLFNIYLKTKKQRELKKISLNQEFFINLFAILFTIQNYDIEDAIENSQKYVFLGKVSDKDNKIIRLGFSANLITKYTHGSLLINGKKPPLFTNYTLEPQSIEIDLTNFKSQTADDYEKIIEYLKFM